MMYFIKVVSVGFFLSLFSAVFLIILIDVIRSSCINKTKSFNPPILKKNKGDKEV